MKRKLDLRILAEAVLLKLYHHGAEVGGPLSPDEVRKLFKIAITSTFMREVLEKLRAEGAITDRIHNGVICFEINTAGIGRVQTGLDDDSTLMSEILKSGDEWLDEDKPLLRDIFPEVGITESSSSDGDFPTYTYFKDSLLVVLAAKEEREGPGYRDLKSVADEFSLKYRPGWVRKAAYSFRDAGYINEAFTMGGGEDGNLDAALTGAGLETAEELRRSGNFDNIVSKGSVTSQSIPAADRIVTLEHNSEQRREIVGAVDAVVEAVKGDNEYGDSHPEEKDAIAAALAAGRKLLDSAKVRVAAIKASLLPVLKFVAETFAKETVKGLAAKAIVLILKWIGMG